MHANDLTLIKEIYDNDVVPITVWGKSTYPNSSRGHLMPATYARIHD